MPDRWLLKSDPDTYSFADLVRERRTVWDGVANPTAVNHLRAMREGDEAFIYETGKVKAIVGRARVVGSGRVDPKNPKSAVVDVGEAHALARPVTLAEVKADPAFAELPLVRIGRLSVMPIPEAAWKRLLGMAGDQTARK